MSGIDGDVSIDEETLLTKHRQEKKELQSKFNNIIIIF